jgi:hypothetical protein
VRNLALCYSRPRTDRLTDQYEGRPAPAKVKRAAEVDELLLDAVDEQQQSRLQIKMKNEAAN